MEARMASERMEWAGGFVLGALSTLILIGALLYATPDPAPSTRCDAWAHLHAEFCGPVEVTDE
jgi:hypothetical protein